MFYYLPARLCEILFKLLGYSAMNIFTTRCVARDPLIIELGEDKLDSEHSHLLI